MQSSTNLALASILIFAAIAGCLGGDGEPQDAGDQGNGTGQDDGNMTQDPDPMNGTNAAPTVVLVVSVNGTAVEAVNGSFVVPLNQTVTFDASESDDPEGGNVTFLWTFGDDTTYDTPTVEHTFTNPGNVTLELEVTDEDGNSTVNEYALVIEAAQGAGGVSGEVLRTETQTYEGTLLATVQASPVFGCNNGLNGDENHVWTIPSTDPATGVPIMVTKWLLTLDASAGGLDIDIFLIDPAGTEIGVGDGPDSNEQIELEGTFLPGDYTVHVLGCRTVAADYTVTGEATIARA